MYIHYHKVFICKNNPCEGHLPKSNRIT